MNSQNDERLPVEWFGGVGSGIKIHVDLAIPGGDYSVLVPVSDSREDSSKDD